MCEYINIYIYSKNVQKKPLPFQEPNDLVLILSGQWEGLRDEFCLGTCDQKFPNSTSHEDRATGWFFLGARLNFELWTKKISQKTPTKKNPKQIKPAQKHSQP